MALENWHSMSPEDVLKELDVDLEVGLSEAEAARRLEQYGRNELREEPPPTFLQRLWIQLNNLVIYLLIVAAIVSGVFGEWYEAAAIMLIVVLNAILGIVQEGRAEQALAELKKMSAPEARVVRDGKILHVVEAEVVPGDIVVLEAGAYIPADLRLIETANLQVDEASLTGESVPVNKKANVAIEADVGIGDRKTMAYKSTIATYGRAKGTVVLTGMQTEIGKIADMIQSVETEQTPLQKRLDQLGRWLVYGAVVICGLVFLIAFYESALIASRELGISSLGQFFNSFDNQQLVSQLGQGALSAFLTAVALAVAAVPEGLPAIVTITLALGMRQMLKRNALIRRLPAVETLGSASVICSDKTGTLTQNEMMAVKLFVPGAMVDISGQGYRPDGDFYREGEEIRPEELPDIVHLLSGAMLASDARLEKGTEGDRDFRIIGDPTEGALIVAAEKANLTRERLEARYPRVDELPFDSVRKRMSTLHPHPGSSKEHVLFVKGAPDIVLDLCTQVYDGGSAHEMTNAMRQRIENVNRDLAQQALRVLAVAQRRFDSRPHELTVEAHESDLTFVGLVGMIDPARPEVKPAIQRAREAGIRTVMVTGDYAETARAIASQISLLREGGEVITGKELETMSDEDLKGHIEQVDVFARVSPEHKVRIVDAFRQKDYVVAMTGDGVNDAPALKRASIGVAMGITGTDVSKETADMILTDDNYVSIVNAVEQGRIIYDNIRKFVAFLLTCNLAEISVIFIGTLLGYPEILTPIQLLWLNLLTDGAPALALGVEDGDPDVMERPPRDPDEPIIDRVLRTNMVVQTIAKTVVTLIAFYLGLNQGGLEEGRSLAFTVLAFSELTRAYSARSEYFSVFRIGVFKNKLMQIAVLVSIVLLLVVIYVPFLNPIFETIPLNLLDWAELIPLMLIPTIAAEVTKIYLRARFLRKAEPQAVAA